MLTRALNLFWQRGYEAATVAELADTMGIRSGSIYACFGSKANLFREALMLYGSTVAGAPLRMLAGQPDVRTAVESMLHVYADAIADPASPSGCMLTLAAMVGSDESEPVRRLLADVRSRIFDATRARIAELMGAGERGDAQATGIARFFTSVVFGMSIQARDGLTRRELDAVIACAMTAWDSLLDPDA